jgi:hypothetical protein
MENIEPLTKDENWILHCAVNDGNWRSALSRLTLPEVERILGVESRKTALPKLRARKRQLEKEYAEAELYECEYPGCDARMPRSHGVVLADGTVFCKPCDARSKQEVPDFEIVDMGPEDEEDEEDDEEYEEEDEDEEDENDDNNDNNDNADPQTSLDQFFNEKET